MCVLWVLCFSGEGEAKMCRRPPLGKSSTRHLRPSWSSALIFLVSLICLCNCCQSLLNTPVFKCKPLLKNLLWLKNKTSYSKTFPLFLEVLHFRHIISRCGFVITCAVCFSVRVQAFSVTGNSRPLSFWMLPFCFSPYSLLLRYSLDLRWNLLISPQCCLLSILYLLIPVGWLCSDWIPPIIILFINSLLTVCLLEYIPYLLTF